jgi:hypothetical protein
MILNSNIALQLAAARRRDLLEAGERARLGAQSQRHASERPPSRATLRWRGPRGRAAAVEPCCCAPGLMVACEAMRTPPRLRGELPCGA